MLLIEGPNNQKMITTLKRYPENFFLMAGLHPVYVKENFKDELKIVRENLKNHNCVAVGEIGLDKHWDVSFLKQQKAHDK